MDNQAKGSQAYVCYQLQSEAAMQQHIHLYKSSSTFFGPEIV